MERKGKVKDTNTKHLFAISFLIEPLVFFCFFFTLDFLLLFPTNVEVGFEKEKKTWC